MDDPLFLWSAQQIVHHPSDPYGFELVWYFIRMPMWAVTKNPPLACYYAALIGGIAGWSERAMHFAFLLPALALILGTYQLARHFTRQPLLAAAITLVAPVVMVSATSVMCDTMMLALWIWAAILWIKGLDPPKPLYLFSSALLISACALTKYYGISLIPLFLAYSLFRRGRIEARLWYLLIPIAALIQYQLWTIHLYGRSLLSAAVSYTVNESTAQSSLFAQLLLGLSFTGGCTLPALFFAPLLWSWKKWIAPAAIAVLAALFYCLGWIHIASDFALAHPAEVSLQLALFVLSGLFVLIFAITDLWQHRDADSLFLALWVLGTFVFATLINWTVNARSVFPFVPAVGILIARRLEAVSLSRARLAILLAVCCVLSLWITSGDAAFANSARQAADMIHDKTAGQPDTVWFAGHWGFQYYMQQHGAQPYDQKTNLSRPGEILIMPDNNSNLFELPNLVIVDAIEIPMRRWVTTSRGTSGAGFYSSVWGPLPFSFGPVPAEHYSFIRLSPR
jgi:4-amino-4-deoxy-L-arabinose transferase-like glycosyltransferase